MSKNTKLIVIAALVGGYLWYRKRKADAPHVDIEVGPVTVTAAK